MLQSCISKTPTLVTNIPVEPFFRIETLIMTSIYPGKSSNHRVHPSDALRGVALSLITLAIGSCIGCRPGQPIMKTTSSIKAIPVKTVAVEQAEVRRTTMQPASVHAYFRAEVRSKSNGYVVSINADIGDFVQQGTTLAVVDVPELQQQRRVLQAQIDRLSAEEKRGQAGVRLAEAQLTSVRAMVDQAKSNVGQNDALLAAADAELNRTEDLVRRGSLQNRMLDESQKKRDAAFAGRQAMTSSVRSAEAEVTVAIAQQDSAKADLASAQAETEIARRQLDELDVLIGFAELKAPFSGVVTERHVELGDLVTKQNDSASQHALFVISQVDKVRVRIPIPETDAPLVNLADKVTLTFPSFANEPPIISGVTRHSNSLDPSTRTLLVETEIDNSDGKLIPGMFGQGSIVLDTTMAANMLPSRAVRFTESGDAYVYVLNDGNTVSVSNIQTGFDDGSRIEIRSGVSLGQQVIDAHLRRFSDGQKVAVLN